MSIDTGFTIEDRIKAAEEAIPIPYRDYRKLEAENAALKEENERLTKVKKNYLETILAIRKMDDIDQARQWCNDTLSGCEPLEATLFNLQNERDVLKARVAALVEALDGAARSLETISRQAGIDEYMRDFSEVRGYARNRALVAFEALAAYRKGG